MTQTAPAYRMLIGGKLVDAAERFEVINPATEQAIASVPDASEDDLDAAVLAARQAFPGWSATPIEERRAVLAAIADAIAADAANLARLLTSEQGKPHADAESEVKGMSGYLKGIAALELPVEVVEETDKRRIEVRRVPIGVVGSIAAWNFPLSLAAFKIGPCLLTGNTLVLKPSPFTPLATLRVAELIADVVPAGVLNIISGSDRLGPWLTSHPGIDKISFTGSTATGKRIMESASHSLKRITLELGGNDPAIVLPDVDVAEIAPKLFWSAFGNNGQICVATKRIYVHKDVYEPLRDAIVEYAKTVQVGDGSQQGTQLGPINNRAQYDRVRAIIADSKAQGHDILTGGGDIEGPGFFIPVTIIDNPPEDSRIVREEQFGPVVPLLRFDDVDDAIARANDTAYGLGASVWGGDEDTATAVAERVSAGTVWVNESRNLTPLAPFGGHRQSGIGVEGGREGLMEYTLAKTYFLGKR
ncbi:aldehyde dehydrogenase family protein [Novosphingobium colocasiae]|uniref:Aldehyde dehydrogenase n=1 Tax=Novosphingobium colocasiae TaxID=1256513 RepID=A0A918UJB0_9SPHN|nr:aldehyde dehydrogenase family protein [Novosphingobium colocasiae]GGZ13984.1 aldehyde dehydrogenase [Novosphingobium colocasiae]